MKVLTIFIFIMCLMSTLSHDQTSNVNNVPNRLDTIDLLFQIGPELPDWLGTVPSDVGWKDQCLFQTWYYHDR